MAVGEVIGEKLHQNKNFPLFNEIRQSKLKMSKEQLGNGLRANQSAAIHPQEIDYLFKSGAINLASGLSILRCLYIFFVIGFNNRSIKVKKYIIIKKIQIIRK